MLYDKILSKYHNNEKQLAFLIDPDKFSKEKTDQLKALLKKVTPDMLLIGGSLISSDIHKFILDLKSNIDLPVIIYPGSSFHITPEADAILFLSLLSGRNPEFLISHHVSAAPVIKANNIEPISTGYLLIDGGSNTSVQYISQTQPIPATKNDIAIATALAGQYMGMKLIYMDAGSGALKPVPEEMIRSVKEQIDIPLIIGGGIKKQTDITRACKAGADIIVIGNALEKDLSQLTNFYNTVKNQ